LQKVSEEILGRQLSITADELKTALSPENFIAVRTIYGGTAPEETRRALAIEREREAFDSEWFDATVLGLKNAADNLELAVAERSV